MKSVARCAPDDDGLNKQGAFLLVLRPEPASYAQEEYPRTESSTCTDLSIRPLDMLINPMILMNNLIS